MCSATSRSKQDPSDRGEEEETRTLQRLRVLAYLRIGILVLLLLAFALRMFRLDGQSLWYDEGVTAEIAGRSFVDLIEWTARDIQPPLYYQSVASWGRLAGWSEWSLRFPSVFFGLLTLPLLYLFALRLTRSRTAAALTLLLAALHPLLIYYSQEARMYAQLVALSLLAAYFLLMVAISETNNGWRWLGYVLAATAAVYTHYFAFILLLALGIAFTIDLLLSSRPPQNYYPFPTLRNFALVNVLILFLYLPWINVMFTRLAVDTSYWQGRFKLWEALRTIGMTFVTGETVLEAQAGRLLPFTVTLTLLSLTVLAWRAWYGIPTIQSSIRTLIYPLLWLMLPILFILILSSFVPKFNSRYVMIALPGLLLLWGSALASLLEPFFDRLRRENLDREFDALGRPIRRRHIFLGLLASVVTLCLLTVFLRSVINWFTEPAFTKAEWRELTSYVRTHRVDDEQLLLVSGHAWPIWNYYASDLPVNRLPDIEILDVNSVLGFERTAALLDSAFDGHATDAKKGAWLISWQDEVMDPMRLVPLHLRLAGHEEVVDARFWQLGLRHFTDIDPHLIKATPSTLLDEPINFGNLLSLVAYDLLANGDLVLYWRTYESTLSTADLQITLQTFTDEQIPYAHPIDRRPAGYLYPFFRWRTNELAVGQIPASEWAGAGAIPGKYRVELGVYDPQGDVAGLDLIGSMGQPLGKRAALDLVLTEVVSVRPRITLGKLTDGFSMAVVLDKDSVASGQAVHVDLWWLVSPTENGAKTLPNETALEIAWRDREGRGLIARSMMQFDDNFAPAEWPMGVVMHSAQRLPIPDEIVERPGQYLLDLQLFGGGNEESGVIHKELEILPSQRTFVAPPLAISLDAVFGEELRLLGIEEALPKEVTVESQQPLRIYWQALAEPNADYTVTVQWIGADGRAVNQRDDLLPGGSSTWAAGEVVGQPLLLSAPVDPGTYQLILALYNAAESDFPRLYTEQGDDFVRLGTIEVGR